MADLGHYVWSAVVGSGAYSLTRAGFYLVVSQQNLLVRFLFGALFGVLWLSLAGCVDVHTNVLRTDSSGGPLVSPDQLPLNSFQFYGSHNSYKTEIAPRVMQQLRSVNPAAASGLDYWHEPLADQLDLGLRVLELDVFYDPEGRLFERGGTFPVLHVQTIDTGSHCAFLAECIDQINAWSELNPGHEPLLISFNAKTDAIDQPGFVTPLEFDATAWQQLDAVLRQGFGAQIINPAEVLSPDGPYWPTLGAAREKVLLLLDEGPAKYEAYHNAVKRPALFANIEPGNPRAAIQVINDPIADAARIEHALQLGLLVRTRADADTVEARAGDTARREAAFASGAHFISTDYYRPSRHFGTDYVVELPGGGSVRCNPKNLPRDARALCDDFSL